MTARSRPRRLAAVGWSYPSHFVVTAAWALGVLVALSIAGVR